MKKKLKRIIKLLLPYGIVRIIQANNSNNKNKIMFSSNEVKLKENNPGIILSFDDYFPNVWEEHFDLFDKYDAKVTFFVTGASVTQFMLNAQDRGHEIGYHTANHPNLSDININDFYEQTVSSINEFKNSGIELTSFSYPYGSYGLWMHNELLKYYRTVRGSRGNFGPYGIKDLKYGFIDSKAIDNIDCVFDYVFRLRINSMLQAAKTSGKIITLTSHSISCDDWGITPKRLEYVLKKSKKYGLKFYRYKDLQ